MQHFVSSYGNVQLKESLFSQHRNRDVRYLMELRTEDLLFSHYAEAGLNGWLNYTPKTHGGWDSPTSQIRGTFTDHWLSAAARIYQETGDIQLKAKADFIVSEISRCQEQNGNGWAFPIPEKYLYSLRDGKSFWAPQYVCHKNMMGLLDMYLLAGNQQALNILLKCADWFLRFTDEISRETMDNMMDLQETGGIMELWADLYAVTGDPRHLELMRRYERPRLTEPVLRGEDVLTNRHANTTIPEIQGCARAYEVTGEERYRRIVEQYWDLAVTRRGAFATGGQTCGEIWTPMQVQSSRLGEDTQEHCVVYNMIRLADYLYRWTGDVKYADYIEQNLYNGILAQTFWYSSTRDTFCQPQEPEVGIVSYYLPLAPGSYKKWGSKTQHFWCCHCTAVQSNARFREYIYYQSQQEITVAQYIPSQLETQQDGTAIKMELNRDPLSSSSLTLGTENFCLDCLPDFDVYHLQIQGNGTSFRLRLRCPWWLKQPMKCWVNGQIQELSPQNGYLVLERTWQEDQVDILLPKGITCWPLADRPTTLAFLYGPVVLAGLIDREITLTGDLSHPETIVQPQNERQWDNWLLGFSTVGQLENFSLIPLYEVGKETYTVYFPI